MIEDRFKGQPIAQDSAERKTMPLCTGALDYFPAALMELARHSFLGNAKHNGTGSELHWARGKSMDHADCIARHLIERGGGEWIEIDGVRHWMRHSAALLWRAAALLQEEMEAEGAAPGRAARFPQPEPKPDLWGVALYKYTGDKRINAIKLVREHDPRLGLKEAKDIVEGLTDGTLQAFCLYPPSGGYLKDVAVKALEQLSNAGFETGLTQIVHPS